jgi:hypothetical protein
MSDEEDFPPSTGDEENGMPDFVVRGGMLPMPPQLARLLGLRSPQEAYEEDLHHMQHQASMKALDELLDESSPETLSTIAFMLALVMADNSFATRLYGQVEAVFRIKHPDVCVRCGVSHIGEILEDMREEAGIEPAKPVSTEPDFTDLQAAGQAEVDRKVAEYYANLKQFSVRVLENNRVECTRCNDQTWPNLADRMMRPEGIEGCPSCMHHQAHG